MMPRSTGPVSAHCVQGRVVLLFQYLVLVSFFFPCEQERRVVEGDGKNTKTHTRKDSLTPELEKKAKRRKQKKASEGRTD